MLRVSTPTRNERLVADLAAVAIDLQALAQRLKNMEGVPERLRQQAPKLAQAGRDAALAAVIANRGRSTRELSQFYGQFLSTSGRKRDELDPFDEAGLMVAPD